MDPDSDKKISEHVLRMHRYRNPGEQDGDRKIAFLFLIFIKMRSKKRKVRKTSIDVLRADPPTRYQRSDLVSSRN